MAEEPQPTTPGPAPTAAEKEREAAALSNLSSQKMTSDDGDDDTPHKSAPDTAALGAAVSNLSIADGTAGKAGGAAGTGAGAGAGGAQKDVKKVKISDADVGFLTRELEVSKKRAGEMLTTAGGDRDVAIRNYVTPIKI